MLPFETRRGMLLEKLQKLRKGNLAILFLHDRIWWHFSDCDSAKLPEAFHLHGSKDGYVYAFLSSIALSENNHKRPSWPNIEKFPEIFSESKHTLSQYRISTKWSTLLEKMVKWGLLPEDYDVKAVSQYIGDNWPADEEFEFELTSDVHDVYCQEYFGSCMHDEPYTLWYDDNPEVVQLVKIKRDGQLVGRSLLWNAKDEDTGESVKYLDRVYPSDGGSHTRATREWARKNGFLYKEYDNMESEDRYDLSVAMQDSRHGYPYMDTFKYARKENDKIILSTRDNNFETILNNTNGVGFDSNACGCCEELTRRPLQTVRTSSWTSQEWCESCVLDSAVCVGEGVASGDYVDEDHAIVLADGNVVASWDAYYSQCEVSQEYYHFDDLISLVDGRFVHSDLAIQLENGDAYLQSSLQEEMIVFYEDEYYFLNDLMEEQCDEDCMFTELELRWAYDFFVNYDYTIDKIVETILSEREKEVA